MLKYIILLTILYFIYKIFNFLKCRKSLFLPSKWNQPNTKKYNNCYAYALQDLKLNRKKKPQPGELCKLNKLKTNDFSCDKLVERVLCDYPNDIYKINKGESCPCNEYEVSLFLDNTNNNKDYHFYKKNSNGFWTHKQGSLAVTNVDADNNLIKDPLKSNRKYKKHNYFEHCSNFCRKI